MTWALVSLSLPPWNLPFPASEQLYLYLIKSLASFSLKCRQLALLIVCGSEVFFVLLTITDDIQCKTPCSIRRGGVRKCYGMRFGWKLGRRKGVEWEALKLVPEYIEHQRHNALSSSNLYGLKMADYPLSCSNGGHTIRPQITIQSSRLFSSSGEQASSIWLGMSEHYQRHLLTASKPLPTQ